MTKLMNKKEEIKNRIKLINEGKIPEGYKKIYGYICPNEWEIKPLNKLFDKIKLKNKDGQNLPVLTNSAIRGVVLQEEYFDREIVSEDNTDNYYIVEDGCFMYNPRISSLAPAGPINKNKLGYTGIASPLYTVFKNKKDVVVDFYEKYFNSTFWFNYMKSISNQGARHDRLNVLDDDFFKMPIPCPPKQEQDKIAEILKKCDKVIELKEKLLRVEYRQKKWFCQNILSGKLRIGNFNKPWKKVKLSEILYEHKKLSSGMEDVHSVAVSKGVVNQIEHLGKCCAAKDTSNYNLVEPGDIVYTKSPTGKFPYGIIKQSKLKYNAIVSPLYGVFRPTSYELGTFIDEFFASFINTNNYLKPIIQKGAKNTINITNSTFLSNYMNIPQDYNELKNIYKIINYKNSKILYLEKELQEYKQLKKSLSQLLLTGIARTVEA